MKATYKLRALGADTVASAIARAPNVTAAARQLGVDRSSLHRWLRSGKVHRPSRGTADEGPEQMTPASPAEWAESVRSRYELTATEQTLVSLAEQALTLARDAVRPADQLAAMSRFQSLVRQIQLEAPDGKTETPTVRTWPRPA